MLDRFIDPQGPANEDDAAAPIWKKIVWFVALAAAGGAATAIVAYVLRAALFL